VKAAGRRRPQPNLEPAGCAALTDRPSLQQAKLSRRPYLWATADALWPTAVARRLTAEFPTEGFRLAGRPGGDACFEYRDIFRCGRVIEDGLARCWTEAGLQLATPAYRAEVSSLFGLELSDAEVSIGLCRYRAGFRLAPHTDRAMRIVTQTIYLNPDWTPAWGGALLILGSSRMRDVQARCLPALNSTVLFVRSPHSWHAVEPVRRGSREPRKSVLLHFSVEGADERGG
jgi:hypothetical protein